MSADNGIVESLSHPPAIRALPGTSFPPPPHGVVADLVPGRAADLRAQLAAVISPSHNAPHGYNDVQASNSASPHDQNIDPAIGGPGRMMSAGGESGGDEMGDGRKGGKRELSQSKRAAQNRAAQVCYCDFIFGWTID
jgi:hypothetical protein